MIYITGDTHGGFQRFGSKYFPQQTQMGRNDYMIICGDFGGLWDGGQKDQHWLDWLAEKPFTTLFVDGNHENFDLLNALPEKEWHGGRVHEEGKYPPPDEGPDLHLRWSYLVHDGRSLFPRHSGWRP